MSATTNTIAFHRRFAAAFDAPNLSKRARIILLITGAAFAWVWLPSLAYLFLQAVIGWKPVPQAQWLRWILTPHGMINSALFAFAVGVIGAGATRRFRWLVGPVLIILVTPLAALMPLWLTRHGLPIGMGGGKISLLRYQFGLNGLMLGQLSGLLFFSALGGLAAPAIFRRVRPSILTAAAGAWVLAGAAGMLLSYWYVGSLIAKGQSSGIIPNYLVFLQKSLPFFLGGLWLGWSLRGNRPWVPAVLLGLMSVYQRVLTTHVGTSNIWVEIIDYEMHLFLPLISALVGAWLGIIIAGARSRRELWRPGALIAGSIILAFILDRIPWYFI